MAQVGNVSKSEQAGVAVKWCVDTVGLPLATGAAILRAYDNYTSTNADIRLFLDTKTQFDKTRQFFGISNNITNSLGLRECVQQKIEECKQDPSKWKKLWQFLTGTKQPAPELSPEQLEEKANMFIEKYEGMSELYGSQDRMKEYADELLQQHNLLKCINLASSFLQVCASVSTMANNSKALARYRTELKQMEEQDIGPILREATQTGQMNGPRLGVVMGQLRGLMINIETRREEAGNEAVKHWVNTAVQGLGFLSSWTNLSKLQGTASDGVVAFQKYLAGAELLMTGASAGVAAWATYNWMEWQSLAADTQEKIDRLEVLLRELCA